MGIVTERDIVQFQVLEVDMARTQAFEVMSQPLFCLNPTDSLWMAHQEMQRRYVRRLVVTGTEGELLGIITQTSFLRSLDPIQMYRLLQTLQQQVCQLEAEKVELLQSRNAELEKIVEFRTAKLQQQAERDRFLSAITQRLSQSFNLQEIFEAAVTEVRQLLDCDRVLVYQFEPDWKGTIRAESVVGFSSILGTSIQDTYFQETQGYEYLQGRKQITADIYQSGLSSCYLDLLEHLQVKAILTIPVILYEKLWGLLVVHQCSHPRQWLSEEIDLLEKLSIQIAIAIKQANTFQQVQTELLERQKAETALQDLNGQLELRVQERTAELANTVDKLHQEIAERKQAETALQEANYKVNSILESITEGFFSLDHQWNFTSVNSHLERILQCPASELLGKNIWEEFPEALGLDFQSKYYQAVEAQTTASFEALYPTLDIWFEVRVYPSADGLSVYFRDISDRKQTEVAICHSEERFRIALKNSPIVVFNQDKNLRYTWIYNPSLGLNTTQVIGKTDFELFSLEEAKKLTALKQEVLKTGVAVREEMIFRYNKDIKCYDLNIEPLQNADGEVVGVSCAALDITHRQKTEQALQESKRFIQQIADSTPNLLYIYDLAAQCNVYTNREVTTILGYTSEAVKEMGKSLFKTLLHPADFAKIIDNNKRFYTAKDGDIIETEYRMKHANGQWRWLYSWDTVFRRMADGTPQQILGTASDITARKLAEEAFRQQVERERLIGAISQRIRQSLELETILTTTVEEVQQFLAADRVLVYKISPDKTGSAIAESVAAPWPRVLNIVFPAEAFPEACYQAYMQGRVYILPNRDQGGVLPCMVNFMQEFAIRAKLVVPIIQKDILWGLLIAHQCSTPRDWQTWEIELLQQLANQLAIAIKQSQLYEQLQLELSERRRAEEQLRQNNEILVTTNTELARATRLKDEFLANMSHELRTPLNAILGMSEGLLEELCGSLTDRQRKAITTIENSGKHLLELINDILNLAKIESGKLELQIAPVAAKRLIESSLIFVKQQAYKKNIKLNSRIPKQLTEIEVDERRMRQVLINLLSNAIKFTLEGGNVTVAVEADREESLVTFSITDTGIGIAPENISKLFQSFVQIDSSLSRRYDGTGLGLALVRKIVELHGGSVSVESEFGKGSCFTVALPSTRTLETIATDAPLSVISCQLPIVPYEDLISDKETFSAYVKDAAGESESPLILLAEDNEANIDTLSNYLLSAGYQLILAKNGWEAVKIAQQHKPSLILMDVQMPEMDGLTATRQIRADSGTASIPIIALTALAMPGDQEKCLEAGASAYMTKPVSLKKLVKTMKDLLLSNTCDRF